MKLLPAVCAVAFCASLISVRADDTPVQAAARAALEQKMNDLDNPQTQTPPNPANPAGAKPAAPQTAPATSSSGGQRQTAASLPPARHSSSRQPPVVAPAARRSRGRLLQPGWPRRPAETQPAAAPAMPEPAPAPAATEPASPPAADGSNRRRGRRPLPPPAETDAGRNGASGNHNDT